MSEKILKGRLVQKHDVAKNWAKATSFIPKQGEVIIYDKDETFNYERVKIGDGETRVNALPFIDDALRTEILAKINTEVGVKVGEVETLLNEHVADETLHITSEERNAWNASEENAKTYTDEQIGSHVHSWNDLEDKPFEETIEVAEIYPLQNIEASEGDEEFDYKGYASDTYLEIKAGNQYTVYINGIEYVCEATESALENEDNDTVIMLGNSAVAHGDDFFTRFYPEELKDTGEPFFIHTRKSKNTICDWKYALGETITLKIVGESVVIKTLDEKFIPDTIARKTDVEPALSLATEAIISNTETISLHTEQITALQTEMATIVEITKEEVDALFAM